MSRAPKLIAVLAAIAAAALFIAACGDDDSADTTTATDEAASSETLSLNGEETVLALDSGTADVLTENKVEVAPVDPASAGDAGISFPITGGEVDSESLAGTIDHSGGLVFSAGGTDVELTDFVIDTAAGTLTASTADGAELVVLDVDLAGLERTDEDGAIVLSGITTTLSDDAATALNDAFSVELFEGGLAIGDVTVTATAG
ncbi:MAG TPA: HtaA domain-containing protein [Solirubrobacterales bacterium]|nr:HtaA domain-containing protein [Solirubrobacterales bacterium]